MCDEGGVRTARDLENFGCAARPRGRSIAPPKITRMIPASSSAEGGVYVTTSPVARLTRTAPAVMGVCVPSLPRPGSPVAKTNHRTRLSNADTERMPARLPEHAGGAEPTEHASAVKRRENAASTP